MNRRNFLKSVGVAGSAVMLSNSLFALSKKPKQPNIILCMTDDQGWGDTGYNGNTVLKTPHLDKMSTEGIRFNRFYAGAPVCSPTRGSAITGRHPYRYGVTSANKGIMEMGEITIAEVLKDQGYNTGHFGKWHLGTLTTKIKESNRAKPGDSKHYSPPWENGFDTCFSTEAKVPTWWKKGKYEEYGTHYWTGEDQMVGPENMLGDDSKIIMDNALPFIEKSAKEKKPFIAVILFHAPHKPILSGPPYTDMYENKKLKHYYGCITAVDDQMGRLRETLKKLDIDKNTMLWFTSDNGPENRTPGSTGGLRDRKRSLHEGGIRVPGLMVWPDKVKKGRITEMPCSTSDYFPTVMELLGYTIPEKDKRPYDGESLLPLIKNKMKKRSAPIGFQFGKQVALIDNKFKLYADKGEYELYDIPNDPAEKNNIAAQHPEVFEKMKRYVVKWQKSCMKSRKGEDYKNS